MKLKKHILSALAVALSLVLVFAFVACGGDKGPKVTAITLDKATAEVETGDTVKLTATAAYDDETTAELKASDVEWASDKPEIATVTRGIVAGKAQGTAVITATYGDYKATCSVTVNAVKVVIEGYTLNEDKKVDLELDATLTLTAKVLKNNVELPDEEIEWTTSSAGIASVADGVVTAINSGEVTITATRKGAVQSASITIVIPEIEGAAKMGLYEQNKTPADTWGFWNDKSYNWSQTTVDVAQTVPYTEGAADEGYTRIGAGKMDITFSVDQYAGDMKPGPHDASIQLFYRSSTGNGGRLKPNYNYEVKLTVLSNTAGTIVVNPFDDIDGRYSMAEDNKEAHTFELEANVEKEITVTFRHGDSGKIYAQGKYTNVESALNLLLGLLSAPTDGDRGNIVKVSVYDVQVKELTASTYQWEDDETELEGYVDPEAALRPSHPDESDFIAGAVTTTGVTLSVQGEGDEAKAVYNLAGTIDMSKFDDVEAAKTWLLGTYFDLQEWNGSWVNYAAGRLSVDINESEGTHTFVIHYDITYTPVNGIYYNRFNRQAAGGDPADLKLSTGAAVPGETITVRNKKFTILNDPDTAWGLVSIKVEKA